MAKRDRNLRTLYDVLGNPLAVNDRVIPVCYGSGIPRWLCNTRATVAYTGRSRVYVKFDQVTYGPYDKPHAAPSDWFRKVNN